MKTKTALAAIAVVGLAALTACSSGGSPEATESGDLTWAMWIGGTADQQGWQKVADEVSKEDPSLKVTIQGAPCNDYWTKIGPQLSSDQSPCIVSMQSVRISQFVSSLVPLDDLIAKNSTDMSGFDEVALKAMQRDGKTYALPYDTGPAVMFYNKDMLDAVGAAQPATDWTMADFEAVAAKLADAGQVAYTNTTEDMYVEAFVMAYNGGRVLKDDGSLDPVDPDWVAGVDWIGSLVTKGWSTQADGADGSADENAFIAKGAAIHIDGPWALMDLSAKVDFTMGVVPLPTGTGSPEAGTTYSAGSGFGISANCPTPDEAYKAITVMTGEQALSILASDGRAFPSRTAIQPEWFAKAEGVVGVDESLAAAQARSIPMPGSEQGQLFNQLLSQYAAPAVNGQQPAETVMAEISSQLGA